MLAVALPLAIVIAGIIIHFKSVKVEMDIGIPGARAPVIAMATTVKPTQTAG